ncbi:MAG: GTPase HflX [Anaerolineae bacterium]
MTRKTSSSDGGKPAARPKRRKHRLGRKDGRQSRPRARIRRRRWARCRRRRRRGGRLGGEGDDDAILIIERLAGDEAPDESLRLDWQLRDVTLKERGLLVGVELRGEAAWPVEVSLDELASLAETAGVGVVGRAIQRMSRPQPSTLVGSGKVEEIKAAAADLKADVIIVDRELSPRQQRNLESGLDIKVIDRTALILDIFAQHARTREGMLQVELAQYEYRLPRLTRMWTHLARQAGGRAGGAGGGVGVRGPGETQLEIDRREIGRRIAFLKGQIETLRMQRRQSRQRRQRSGLPAIALVGYTNAGKSTLANALLGENAIYAADQLFATLDPTTRRVQLANGRQALLSDTVGFIQRLPTELVAAFRATLEEVTEADALLHVVDLSHPAAVDQAETVEHVLAELGLEQPPMAVAVNKIDRVIPPDRLAALGKRPDGAALIDALEDVPAWRALCELYPDAVPICAADGIGLDALREALDEALREGFVSVDLLVPYRDGDLLHRLHVYGIVDAERFEATGTRVTAQVPPFLLGEVAPFRQP